VAASSFAVSELGYQCARLAAKGHEIPSCLERLSLAIELAEGRDLGLSRSSKGFTWSRLYGEVGFSGWVVGVLA
jgi:hypothetical protein